MVGPVPLLVEGACHDPTPDDVDTVLCVDDLRAGDHDGGFRRQGGAVIVPQRTDLMLPLGEVVPTHADAREGLGVHNGTDEELAVLRPVGDQLLRYISERGDVGVVVEHVGGPRRL